MTYSEAVQYLYSLGNEVQTMKLGLERISALLDALDRPDRAYRIVHIAGTNGKGSTCAMIDAGLRAAGIRTGLFTSPHLMEPTERISLDGLPVSQAEFARAFKRVHETALKLNLDMHPTYFECVTAMALVLFRDAGMHTVVLETGLGGRLDSTNAVTPALCVITAIDYDHQQYLGDTIELIAAEKAGILKPGVPAVFAKQIHVEAARVLAEHAKQVGSPVTYGATFPVEDVVLTARGTRFSLNSNARGARYDLEVPLPGEHQVDNAVTAALALQALGVSPQGIAETSWPGRIEHVAPNPDVLLDGAHNPGGARALATYLKRFYSDRRIWMIYGAMRDKAVAETSAILFPLAHELIFTAPHNTRSMPPSDLQALAGRGQIAPDTATALELTLKQVSAEDVIVITGSLYLVGEARQLFLHTTGGRW